MSDPILDATVGLRSFLFEAVYENEVATAEFKKAAGILGGLWEKVRRAARRVPRRARRSTTEGLDAAAKDFLAGMTDRYAVTLYEQLFIPKPWVSIAGPEALALIRRSRVRSTSSRQPRAPQAPSRT